MLLCEEDIKELFMQITLPAEAQLEEVALERSEAGD